MTAWKQVILECDAHVAGIGPCGQQLGTLESSTASARGVAARAGWRYKGDPDRDFCPEHADG